MPHDHPDHDHDHDHAHAAPHRPAAEPAANAPHHPTSHAPGAAPVRGRELPEGAGRGQVLFLDAFSGIAGDMLVAALVDLGVPPAALERGLAALPLQGYELRWSRRPRSGIGATALDVVVHAPQPARDYAEIRAMLESASSLPSRARELALHAFAILAEAEASVHGVALDSVHFHEVGAVDSIVDVVASAIALTYLDATVACSPLPLGRGFVNTSHGRLPLPAPATLACLAGAPTIDAGIDGELVTPTGACLVRAATKRYCGWPAFMPVAIGWGAGTRELPDRPNLLRVVLGTPSPSVDAAGSSHAVLELNVDDLTGELAAAALASALEAGALDAWSTAIGMKKGRPALQLSALVSRPMIHPVSHALLRETSSLGLRVRPVDRIERPRRMVEVVTEFGAILVKVAEGDGLPANAAPEYESCRQAALVHGVPIKHVFAAAVAAYWRDHR